MVQHGVGNVRLNLVALEDPYGYRIVARHPTIRHDEAAEPILAYARLATGNPLEGWPAPAPPRCNGRAKAMTPWSGSPPKASRLARRGPCV